jgi:hypothetical protein
MCTRPNEDPAEVLNQVSAKLAFLGDAFSQHKPFEFSVAGEFGFHLILRGLEDEVKHVEIQLFEAEEVKS